MGSYRNEMDRRERLAREKGRHLAKERAARKLTEAQRRELQDLAEDGPLTYAEHYKPIQRLEGPSGEADAELVDRQTVMLNGQYVELTGLALEVMRAMTKAEHQAVKDAFRRGYQGALGFARGVCDEHNADLDHVKSRIDRARHRKQGEAEMERIAANIVTAIFDDLRDRRFLKWLFSEQPTLIGRLEGDELHSLDADVQQEIRTAWGGIIVAALRAALEASDEQ